MERVESTPIVAPAAAAFAVWISAGSLALTDPLTGARVGFLPPVWLIPILMAAAILAARRFRLSRQTSLPLYFSLVLLLPWLPVPVPFAFFLWYGPATIGVWIAVGVAMVMAQPPRLMRVVQSAVLPGAVAFVAYLLAAWSIAPRTPTGDEPHYLVITQSILRDGDIRVENNYKAAQYREYYSGSLRGHYGRPGLHGDRYSIHAPGVSAVVAPAFAVAGHPAVVVFLSLIAAAGSMLLWRGAYVLTASVSAAWFAWAAGALSAPFFFEAFSVYPDGLGATLVLVAALPLVEQNVSTRRWIATGAALGLLPWLHTRFAVIAGVMSLVLLLRLIHSAKTRAQIAPFLIVPLISAVAWFGFFRVIYGTFNPSSPYGGTGRTTVANMAIGLPGLWFDQQFGVLPNAPVFALCLAGLLTLWRQRPRLALELSVVGITYVLTVSAFDQWWAGNSAPARFLAPMLPLFAIPVAWFWATATRESTRAAGIAALTASLLTTLMLAAVNRGGLLYNSRNGYSRAVDWLYPLVDVSRALPSFFLHTPVDAVRCAGVWAVFICAALWAVRMLERKAEGRGFLGFATLTCLALACMSAAAAAWEHDDVAPGRESSLGVLASYHPRLRPMAVDLQSWRIASSDVMVPKLAVSTQGRGVPSAQTLLLVPIPIPAGEYEVHIKDNAPLQGSASLIAGRQARPSWVWDLSELRREPVTVRFPMPIGSLVVVTDNKAPEGALTLVPRRVWLNSSRVTSELARRIERYGPARAFFLAGHETGAIFEESGFWVRSGRRVRLAVSPVHDHAALQMLVKNRPASNRVYIGIGQESRVYDLRSEEELTIPLPDTGNRPGTLIEIESTSGFDSAQVEPSSADRRQAGVRIEFREPPDTRVPN